MTVLAPGTFRVSDYRKPIPERVKRAAVAWTARSIALGDGDIEGRLTTFARAVSDSSYGKIQFDHRPPLQDRPYDTEARDFIPPQNDPEHIDAVLDTEHLARTVGAPGRTERGDADRRARVRSLANKTEDARARAAAKVGQKHERRTDIPPPTKGSQKPKAKIARPKVYQWPKGRKIANPKHPWGKK